MTENHVIESGRANSLETRWQFDMVSCCVQQAGEVKQRLSIPSPTSFGRARRFCRVRFSFISQFDSPFYQQKLQNCCSQNLTTRTKRGPQRCYRYENLGRYIQGKAREPLGKPFRSGFTVVLHVVVTAGRSRSTDRMISWVYIC